MHLLSSMQEGSFLVWKHERAYVRTCEVPQNPFSLSTIHLENTLNINLIKRIPRCSVGITYADLSCR